MRTTEESRLYMRRYRAEHPDYGKISARKYYEAHRSEVLERARAKYETLEADAKSRLRQSARIRSSARYHADPLLRTRQGLGTYGLTIDEYTERLAAQGGGCYFCGRQEDAVDRVRRLSVEHDHKTGRIRGLVCMACNLSLIAVDHGRFSMLYRDPEKLSRYIGRKVSVDVHPDTPRRREAVALWLAGKTTAEVGAAMGITKGNAYVLLNTSVTASW